VLKTTYNRIYLVQPSASPKLACDQKNDIIKVDELFYKEGFISVTQCPSCQSFNLLQTEINFDNEVEIECFEIQFNDLRLKNSTKYCATLFC
jgi:Zn ribbon nucleic-acid-binding protein